MNWTATYRSDSVLNTPYEKFSVYKNLEKLPSVPAINYAFSKTKLISWFVSNCDGTNGRTEYVKELQKYAKVDVHGECGPLTCSRLSNSCFEMLETDYKFYLAFENSNCRDYITEKFFVNALGLVILFLQNNFHIFGLIFGVLRYSISLCSKNILNNANISSTLPRLHLHQPFFNFLIFVFLNILKKTKKKHHLISIVVSC